ncbi:MAG TPA: HEPN domain-containing protein [Proteobacteria bacterium]|nr:HEPN domain protein [bacterium BMS3Abin14]HDL52900.1 HEPN domain-containing protein [Pseudomonadota bacterium]
MKAVTTDWLRSARADLETINAILDKPNLAAVVAFHAQQCVEKCLKALLEEIDIEVGKTHSLLTLKAAAERDYSIDWDEDTLSLLNKLYIDSRYPTESGLLPNGAPSLEDARDLARFAAEAMDEADALLTR